MDKLEQYQIAIKQVLTEYHNWVSGAANLTDESCLIFDDNNHHYIWGFLGWDGKKRTNNIQVNIRIKNDKIWIDGHYYRINKISGASLTETTSVEVELLKTLPRQINYTGRRRIVTVR